MRCRIIETRPRATARSYFEQHSPQTVRYMADPNGKGVIVAVSHSTIVISPASALSPLRH